MKEEAPLSSAAECLDATGHPAVLDTCTLHMNGCGDRGDHSHQSGQETICLVRNTYTSVTCLQAEHVLWKANIRRAKALSMKGVLERNSCLPYLGSFWSPPSGH